MKGSRKQGEEMAAQVVSRKEMAQKEQIVFQQIFSDQQLAPLLVKHPLPDERRRKLLGPSFFWWMVFRPLNPGL